MKLWDRIKNFISPRPTVDMQDERLLEWLGITTRNKNIVGEITYFTCLKMLSETLGKMPLKMYQETEKGIIKAPTNEAYRILKTRPNPYMTPSTFWATVENNRNHYGNAYVYIRRVKENNSKYAKRIIKDFWIMPSDDVEILVDNEGYFGEANRIWYSYTDKHSGETYLYNHDDVMHFKTSFTFDGITGLPVREILKSTLEGNLESQEFIGNLYKSGLTAKATLEFTGDLDEKKKKVLIKGLEEFANGSANAGKIIPIPLGMKLTPLNIKLTDSQFFEIKKYSALQIAGAFGIKPNQINDYEKSSYANSETQQLSFYVDTELFILKNYEEEATYKVLDQDQIDNNIYFKFNEKVILRTDSASQMESLSKAVNNGIYTPNEAREFLDKPSEEGGDTLIVNGNYIPITQVGNQYTKGGENNKENT